MMGVRYYMATSANAIAAARGNPELTEVATSGPWVIFEVADSEIVEALANEPAVVEGVDDSLIEWVEEPWTSRAGSAARRSAGSTTRRSGTCRWPAPVPTSGSGSAVGERPEAVPLDDVEVSEHRGGRGHDPLRRRRGRRAGRW